MSAGWACSGSGFGVGVAVGVGAGVAVSTALDGVLLTAESKSSREHPLKRNGDTLKASGEMNDYTISSIDSNGNLPYNQTVAVFPCEEGASNPQTEESSNEEI